ncbi:hypothetical protein AAG570_005488 [Ranatra chinensis]|uniref:Dynein heavy chain n=1 Tax=Ranatra chinensis TaxID=642074 RepID=A0ABD0YCK4_9HEMI
MDSNSVAPLIFILSPGVDPMQALLLFAQKMDYSEKFDSISLGQGQGPIALTMIRKAQNEGSWVCLQNCHLATSWMPALEKICDNFDPTNTHSNFRIWLTSYPSAQFPVSILQNGVKMTNEAPEGLQQSLIRSYTSDPVCEPDFYESCQGKEQIFAKLLFGITFFHAVVQERRKFGPIGWNIPYGFNESDYLISIHQLQMYVMEYADIPYEAVTYLTGECNYGGRVTDNWDRRALNTLLAEYINPDVVFNPDYSLVEDDRAFTLPLRYDYREFIKFIDSLPASPTPEVFGLHSNAGITRNLNDTGMLLEAMLLVKGEAVGGDSGKSDQLIYTIAHDINSKVPPPFDLDAAMTKYPTEYTESMNTVLVQEMERFNRLLRVISGTLVAIQKAIKGVVAMSPELEALYNSLLISRIPAAWAKVSYPSLKPLGSYVNDFLERIKFLHMWYLNGKPPNFWLSGFFFTQAFLTGAMQNYARRYTIPIDQLVYDFKILKVDKTQDPPSNGVYVYGLFLEGARWDRKSHSLAEQYPKILSDTMPLIWIVPCRKEELNEGGRYVCPLYKTTERKGVLSTTGHSTNYVLPILIETRKPTKHWVKRGVALMCQLSD